MDNQSALADTGFLVAIVNRRDARPIECVSIYERFSRIRVPQIVLAESVYLIQRDAGSQTVVQLLHGLAKSRFELIALSDADVTRIVDI